jgi:hypothetical protein
MTDRAIVVVVYLSRHGEGGSEEILLFLFSVICTSEGVLKRLRGSLDLLK